MATRWDYQASTEGAERILAVPYARLEDTTPEVGHAALLLSAVEGTQVGGVVLSLQADLSRAVIDVTPGKLYWMPVRNVITYSGSAEATFRAINIGDPIYYDESATMPAGVELSTSPLDAAGNANAVWGYAWGADQADELLYPKGTTTASTQNCGVLARGAGA